MNGFKEQTLGRRLGVLAVLAALGWGLWAGADGWAAVVASGLGIGATVALVSVALPFEAWVRLAGARGSEGRAAVSLLKEMVQLALMVGLIYLAVRAAPALPHQSLAGALAVVAMVGVITGLGESITDRSRAP